MSKKILALLFASIVLVQCTEKKAEQTAIEESEIVLISEELKPYALTVIDSVYSVYIKLASVDSAVVQYNVQLVQGTEIFKDSLVFSIPAGQEVAGEFIFPACRVKNQAKPSLTSNVKRLHDK
jgi:branched-subunit amino acid permease